MKNCYFSKEWFYVDLFDIISINWTNPFKTMNKLKGIFKPLKRVFWFGKRTNIPLMYLGSPAKLLDICVYDVTWKDKWRTPRYEEAPNVCITLFGKWSFIWYWTTDDPMSYWEQALWYLFYYSNKSYGRLEMPNIAKARESWQWTDLDGNSNWKDEYLTNEALNEIGT